MVYTSPTKKARIVVLKEQGLSNRDIATRLGVHHTTVGRIFQNYGETQDFKRVGRKPGRPPKLTTEDVRYGARLLAMGRASNATDLQMKYFSEITPQTMRERLREAGLKAYVRRQKPLLTEKHMKRRFEWAKDHAHWTVDDWKSVVFSDESKINLVGSDGRQWCWRKPGEELDPRYVSKKVKHGGGSIMIWGCMTSSGLGRLVRIEGNMDGPLYVEILNDDLLGSLKDLDIKKKDIYFQQDNDPKHTSRVAKDWFVTKRVDVLDWPANSPDMNIIEHVWDYVDRRVRTRPTLHRNCAELFQALLEEWAGIEEEYIDRLFSSMPERVAALVKAKGGYTRW